MEENKALKHVVTKFGHSVKLAIRLWASFKINFLEKHQSRMEFDCTSYTADEFRELTNRILGRSGPSEVRPKESRLRGFAFKTWFKFYEQLLHEDSSVQVIQTENGLGLAARADRELSALSGYYLKLEDVDFEKLKRANYPSLYKSGILFGPLSLLNQDCGSKLKFGEAAFKSQPAGFEEFGVVRLKDIRPRKRPAIMKKGEEILVNYGMGRSKGFECKCKTCRNKRKKIFRKK